MMSCYFNDIYWLGYGPFVTVSDVLVTKSSGDEIFVSWCRRQNGNIMVRKLTWKWRLIMVWAKTSQKRCQNELIVTSYYGGVYNVQTNPKNDVVARSLKRHNFYVRFLTSKKLSKSTMTWQFYDVRIWRQYDVISNLMCPLGNYFYYSLNQILQPKIAYCTHGLHDAILFVRWSWCLNFFFKVQMKTKKTRSCFKSSDLEERESFCGNETRSLLEMIELSLSYVWTTLIRCLNQPNHKSMTSTRRYILRPVNTPPLPNTLWPRRNGSHFPNNIFKCIFLNENVWISIYISLQFVPKGPINNIPALVQIMAWRRTGANPLSEPMMA